MTSECRVGKTMDISWLHATGTHDETTVSSMTIFENFQNTNRLIRFLTISFEAGVLKLSCQDDEKEHIIYLYQELSSH